MLSKNDIRSQLKNIHLRLDEIANFSNISKNSSWYPISENLIVTSLYTGQKIIVDRRDLSLSPSLIINGEWEIEFSQLFRSLIKPNDIVFDIGANVGYFGLISSTENHQGYTHYFEANPTLCDLIEKTMWLNDIPKRSTISNFAISDLSNKIHKLNVPRDLLGSGTLMDRNKDEFENSSSFEIKSITIDDYCQSKNDFQCDIMKIDIEGFEEKALYGMNNTINKNDNIKIAMGYTHGAYTENLWPFITNHFNSISAFDEIDGLVQVSNEIEVVNRSIDSGDWCMLLLEK